MARPDAKMQQALALYARLLDVDDVRRNRVLTTRIVRLLDTFDQGQTTAYYRDQRKLLDAWRPRVRQPQG